MSGDRPVLVIGCGLIGTSLALALTEQGRTVHLADAVPSNVELAVSRGAGSADSVDDPELVVVAVPPSVVADVTLKALADHPEAVVTDVTSVKTELIDTVERSANAERFVGGHPMAGKTQSIEGATADLFKGATWCVCPLPTAKEEAVRNVLGMIAALDAEPYFIDAHEHDGHVAGVSHLPFVLSAAMVNAVSGDPAWRDMRTLTSSGFRDTSRLAAGSPTMHRDIAITNREAVTRWIDATIAQLQKAQAAMTQHDTTGPEELLAFFTQARDARAEWATQTGREGELVQNTEMDLVKEGFGDQMGRMLLGGFSKKRRSIAQAGRSSGNDRQNPNRS